MRAYTGSWDAFAAKLAVTLASPAPAPPMAEGASSGEAHSATLRMANLRVAMLHVPSQAKVNQPITISANVVNDGSETGSTRAALKINGQVEQTRLVTVGPGGSRPIKFTVTKSEPGTYTVIMGSQRANLLVTDDGASSTSVDGGTIVMILLGFLIVAIFIVVMLSCRRPTY